MKTFQWNHKGFTLAEMAIVVLLIGIAMTMGLKMMTATLQNTAITETKAKQERIKLALIGFLRTNGRLPCPDITTNPANASYGLQDRVGIPDSNCTAPPANVRPVLPWRDLGLSRDDVQDGWKNFFTYRVANNTNLTKWTSRTGATAFTINHLTSSIEANVLTVQERNGAATSSITNPRGAIVCIISHGRNGLGARTIKGAANTAPTSADEVENTDADSIFITGPFNEAAINGGPFDDFLAFMTPQDLLQPLISEKTLKASCASYCTAVNLCPVAATCAATNIPIGAAAINPCACAVGEDLPRN